MKNKKGRFLITMGLLLIASAGMLAAYNLYDDFRAKDSSQQSVEFLEEIIVAGGADRLSVQQQTSVPNARQTGAPETQVLRTDVAAGVTESVSADSVTAGETESVSADSVTAGETESVSADSVTAETNAQPTPAAIMAGTESAAPSPAASADSGIAALPAESAKQSSPAVPDPAAADASESPSAAPSPQPDLPFRENAEIVTMLQEGEVPDYILNPEMEMPVISHNGQDYIGVLEIPALELKIPVISQWNYTRLKIAPCRYTGSAYTNNLVISAHNYKSHFGSLKKLDGGERVIFTDVDGNRFDYIVEMQEVLRPGAVEAMTEEGWDLTLFTCTLGGSYRLAVRCSLMPKIPVR